jgi:signal transduction histidine kinase
MAIYTKKGKSLSCHLEKKDLSFLATQAEQQRMFHVSATARYVCVYLHNDQNKYAFIYGTKEDPQHEISASAQSGEVHREAIRRAFTGSRVVYEWFDGRDKNSFYQSTIIPLSDHEGKVESVLGVVKVLDKISAVAVSGNLTVSEDVGQSFIRLLMNAREEEKHRISSALHDEIGTAAVVINSLLGILKEDIKDGERNAALSSLKNVASAFEESISKIKKVIRDLRPPQLDEIGLHAAVKELIDTLSTNVPLKFEYSYKIKDKVEMSEAVKITLYRTVQEAISNTLKHAKASKIKIEFAENESIIFLKIQDDGIGYSSSKQSEDKMGIKGIKENISYIGGSVRIEGVKGKGTTLTAECPKITYVR